MPVYRDNHLEEIYNLSNRNFKALGKILENKYFLNQKALEDFHPNALGHQIMANHISDLFANRA